MNQELLDKCKTLQTLYCELYTDGMICGVDSCYIHLTDKVYREELFQQYPQEFSTNNKSVEVSCEVDGIKFLALF